MYSTTHTHETLRLVQTCSFQISNLRKSVLHPSHSLTQDLIEITTQHTLLHAPQHSHLVPYTLKLSQTAKCALPRTHYHVRSQLQQLSLYKRRHHINNNNQRTIKSSTPPNFLLCSATAPHRSAPALSRLIAVLCIHRSQHDSSDIAAVPATEVTRNLPIVIFPVTEKADCLDLLQLRLNYRVVTTYKT